MPIPVHKWMLKTIALMLLIQIMMMLAVDMWYDDRENHTVIQSDIQQEHHGGTYILSMWHGNAGMWM